MGEVRAWRAVAIPSVRFEILRAASIAFVWTLVEPAGPLILGRRRTLAVLILSEFPRQSSPHRLAVVGLVTLGIGTLGALALLSWGHRRISRGAAVTHLNSESTESQREFRSRATRLGAVTSSLVLCTWIAVCILPLAGLWHLANGNGRYAQSAWPQLAASWQEHNGSAVLSSSILLGGGSCVFAFAISLLFMRFRSSTSQIWGSKGIALVPPLVLALGLVLAIGAFGPEHDEYGGLTASVSPGIACWLAILAVGWLLVPAWVACLSSIAARARDARGDVARLLGARCIRLWWISTGSAIAPTMLRTSAIVLLAGIFEASAVLLFCPTSDLEPFGMAVLDWRSVAGGPALAGTCALVGCGLLLLARLVGLGNGWFGPAGAGREH